MSDCFHFQFCFAQIPPPPPPLKSQGCLRFTGIGLRLRAKNRSKLAAYQHGTVIANVFFFQNVLNVRKILFVCIPFWLFKNTIKALGTPCKPQRILQTFIFTLWYCDTKRSLVFFLGWFTFVDCKPQTKDFQIICIFSYLKFPIKRTL